MSLFGTGRKEAVLAVLFLIALALLQHAPGVLLGRPREAVEPGPAAAVQQPPAESATNAAILLPAMRQAGQVVRDGAWPTWNPYARFGEPFAVSGAPLWYPPYWPLALEDGARWLDAILCLHAALACVLAFRMLRALSVSRYAAFIGAGLYGLGWFFTTALDRLPEAAAAAWLPWIVTSAWNNLFARRHAAAAARLGLAVAVPFATGGVATATLGASLALACTLAGLLAIDREDRRGAAGRTLVACILAALCTAPQWLPALELAPALADPADGSAARLQTVGLLAFLMPGLFGELGGGAPSALVDLNPAADTLELALYPGALVLLVAMMGLLRPKRTRLALYWILVAGGALLLALDGPVSATWHEVSPLLLRRPGAPLAIFHLATVVLVALGLENFFDAPRARPYALPIAAATALGLVAVAVVALFGSPEIGAGLLQHAAGPLDAPQLDAALTHTRQAAVVPLVALTLLALAFLVWQRLGILHFKRAVATVALGELCVLALLHTPRGTSTDGVDPAAMLPAGAGRVVRVGEAAALPPGALAGRHGVRAIDTAGDQILARTARYLETVEPGVVRLHARAWVGPFDRAESAEDPLLASAGLGAALATRAMPPGRLVPLAAAPGVAAADARAPQPYAALDAVPRVRVAFDAEVADSAAEAELALRARGLPFRLDRVVVEGAPAEFRCVRPTGRAVVEVLDEGPDRLRVRVDVGDGRGYLVVADAHAPGWRATVDGHPTAILPADLAFRAVPLREGVHEVVLEHRPGSLPLGLGLAAAGLAAALVMLLASRRR